MTSRAAGIFFLIVLINVAENKTATSWAGMSQPPSLLDLQKPKQPLDGDKEKKKVSYFSAAL